MLESMALFFRSLQSLSVTCFFCKLIVFCTLLTDSIPGWWRFVDRQGGASLSLLAPLHSLARRCTPGFPFGRAAVAS